MSKLETMRVEAGRDTAALGLAMQGLREGPMPAPRWQEAPLRTIEAEQAGLAALAEAMRAGLGQQVCRAVQLVHGCGGRAIVTGMGKSGHIARKLAATFASTGTPAHYVHPGEASHGDLGMIADNDVVIGFSWSGETPEMADLVGHTRRFGVPLVGVTSNEHSALARAADVPLILPRMPEACPNGLAPTTSTTMQLAIADAIAVSVLERRGFSAQDFRILHPGGKLGAKLRRAGELMRTGEELPLTHVGAYLRDAIVTISSKRMGATGVVNDEGDLVGIITDGDLRRAVEHGLRDRPVVEFMQRSPHVVPRDMLAQEVLAAMNAASITCVFVGERGRVEGAIHLHDLLRAGVV